MRDVLRALLDAPDPPVHYALTARDVRLIAECFDWEGAVDEHNWRTRGETYRTVADMVRANPSPFLADLSAYYGDDYYE